MRASKRTKSRNKSPDKNWRYIERIKVIEMYILEILLINDWYNSIVIKIYWRWNAVSFIFYIEVNLSEKLLNIRISLIILTLSTYKKGRFIRFNCIEKIFNRDAILSYC